MKIIIEIDIKQVQYWCKSRIHLRVIRDWELILYLCNDIAMKLLWNSYSNEYSLKYNFRLQLLNYFIFKCMFTKQKINN